MVNPSYGSGKFTQAPHMDLADPQHSWFFTISYSSTLGKAAKVIKSNSERSITCYNDVVFAAPAHVITSGSGVTLKSFAVAASTARMPSGTVNDNHTLT